MPTTSSLAKIKKGRGGKLAEEWARFRGDTAYFEVHREELLEKYPDQWVAIYNQQVVGESADARQLLADLKGKGIPLGQVVVKYLPKKEELLILHA